MGEVEATAAALLAARLALRSNCAASALLRLLCATAAFAITSAASDANVLISSSTISSAGLDRFGVRFSLDFLVDFLLTGSVGMPVGSTGMPVETSAVPAETDDELVATAAFADGRDVDFSTT